MKIAAKEKPFRLIAFAIIFLVLIGATTYYLLVLTKSGSVEKAPTQAQQKQPQQTVKKTLLLPGAKTTIPLPIDPALLKRPDGQLVLVNKTTPNELTYEPADLVLPNIPYRTDKSQTEMMVRGALVKPLDAMFAAAKSASVDLVIASAYRSSTLQETYFNSYVRASGLEEAEKYIAHPGTSEHQTGMAVDFTTPDMACYLVECFEETVAGKWLAANAHTYGFILRYPKDKVDVTKYNYEPWHFRYLGVPVSSAVYESGLSYEEAFPYLSGEKKP